MNIQEVNCKASLTKDEKGLITMGEIITSNGDIYPATNEPIDPTQIVEFLRKASVDISKFNEEAIAKAKEGYTHDGQQVEFTIRKLIQ